MAAAKRKQAVICISSSDEEDGEVSESEERSESEFEVDGDEEEAVSEDGSLSSNYEDSHDDDDYGCGGGDDDNIDDDDGDGDGDDLKGKPSDEELCNKVINHLKGKKSLDILKLEECRAYLRKHEIRICGTKETCILRILEHWRIKDGNGEKLYPASSFVINCTGDVCNGDVVLFKQRVYEKFDRVTRGGGAKIIGKRIVAGKVVAESYGAAKQQHTFSIDVLWSKGVKALPPLYPLLVKGRNLYRLKTTRQRWLNEADRSKVLAEKHSRGAAARHTRAIAKAMATNKGSKHKRITSTSKAPPRKKQKKELEHNTSRKSNTKRMTDKAKRRNTESPSTSWNSKKMREEAKRRNSGSSSAHDNARMRDVTKMKNYESSVVYPEQPSYHANRIFRENPYPQNYPYNNYSPAPRRDVHGNYTGIAAADLGMHHIPNQYRRYASSALEGPHGPIMHGHIAGHASYVHGQIPDRLSYVSQYPYGNPVFQYNPRHM